MTRVIDLYEKLHTMPELGFEEYKTAAFLAAELEKAGFAVTTQVGGKTGVVGLYDSGKPGPVIALRADMDALGHQVDGQIHACHTCGHDAHCAMVLAAAEELATQGQLKQGKLKILFQPAEELGTGALSMIQAGVAENVDMLLGLHLRPKDEVGMGRATPALYHAASERLQADFHGVPAHGARPHLGVNVIDAAAAAVNAVNAIHLNPTEAYSIKATRFLCDAGVTNAIPAEARVVWDVRSEYNPSMKTLLEKAEKAIQGSAATVGAEVELKHNNGIPAAEYHEEAMVLLTEAITAICGAQGLHPPVKTPGGEDFHFFMQKRPTLKVGYFGLGCDLTPGLHHPDMQFNLQALPVGQAILVHAVKAYLKSL